MWVFFFRLSGHHSSWKSIRESETKKGACVHFELVKSQQRLEVLISAFVPIRHRLWKDVWLLTRFAACECVCVFVYKYVYLSCIFLLSWGGSFKKPGVCFLCETISTGGSISMLKCRQTKMLISSWNLVNESSRYLHLRQDTNKWCRFRPSKKGNGRRGSNDWSLAGPK